MSASLNLRLWAILLLITAANSAYSADGIKVPKEIAAFVLEGTKLITLNNADLNSDGRADVVIVLDRPVDEEDPEIQEGQRSLILLLRQADGTLRSAGRNDRVIYCSSCGGVFGDPFNGVETGSGTFTVRHYGGSAYRWGFDYTFSYSAPSRDWLLTAVREINHNTFDTESGEEFVFTAPNDFGRIRFADFDPFSWRGKGEGTAQKPQEKNELCIGWSSGDAVHMSSCEVKSKADCSLGQPEYKDYDFVREYAEGVLFKSGYSDFYEHRTTVASCDELLVTAARNAENVMSGQWGRWTYAEKIEVGGTAFVYGDNVRLRAGPSTQLPIVTTLGASGASALVLGKGLTVELNEMSAAWFNIEVNGVRGWVWGQFLHPNPQSTDEFI